MSADQSRGTERWLHAQPEYEPFNVEQARLFANRYTGEPVRRRLHQACDEIERLRAQAQKLEDLADYRDMTRGEWRERAERAEEQLRGKHDR